MATSNSLIRLKKHVLSSKTPSLMPELHPAPTGTKLPEAYYRNTDLLGITQDLLGKVLCTQIDSDVVTSGIIVETEAYSQIERGSHAYNNRRTPRPEIMFGHGGVSYVYLCYGMHYLFNVVVGIEGHAEAVLVRAIQPLDGMEVILKRRNATKPNPKLGAGPGSLCKCLGIDKRHYGIALTGDTVWIEDRGIVLKNKDIIKSPRVGIAYAKEDALLPWRHRVKDSPYTSLPKL